jgi:SAM-dependent methyltransferase
MPAPLPPNDEIARERARIEAEYRRRAAEVPADFYAPWQPWVRLLAEERERVAAGLLRRAGVPLTAGRVLEVGCGAGGWLPALRAWGVEEHSLHGIDLDRERLAAAAAAFPAATLLHGDAAHLPWPDRNFHLVVASTVFSSILAAAVRRRVAAEVERVLAPGGALLWYDLRYNNPRNPNVRGIGRGELRQLFPALRGPVRSLSLAPPLARALAPRSLSLARALSAVPFLRSHLLAVLRRGDAA